MSCSSEGLDLSHHVDSHGVNKLLHTTVSQQVAVAAPLPLCHIDRELGSLNREPGSLNRELASLNREPRSLNGEPGSLNREPEARDLVPHTTCPKSAPNLLKNVIFQRHPLQAYPVVPGQGS